MNDGAVTALISIACTILGALFGYLAFARNRKKDQTAEGERSGAIASDIGYIKGGVDDLKRETREMRGDVQGLTERVVRCEESCKQAHHRIDEIRGDAGK